MTLLFIFFYFVEELLRHRIVFKRQMATKVGVLAAVAIVLQWWLTVGAGGNNGSCCVAEAGSRRRVSMDVKRAKPGNFWPTCWMRSCPRRRPLASARRALALSRHCEVVYAPLITGWLWRALPNDWLMVVPDMCTGLRLTYVVVIPANAVR